MSESPANTNDQAQGSLPDWSHIRETINMLFLAICQIEATMTDSNKAVDTLTESFTALANHTQSVSAQIQELTEPEQLAKFKVDISETAANLQNNISASIQAFQFYDRVCQRLEHVSTSLENVCGLLDSDISMQNPGSWKKIQEQIKSSYTMEAERIMFEFIMRGGSVNEALEIYQHHFTQESTSKNVDEDEIELF
ncbi:MAG: hypothetical protein ACI93R_002824 [Flavobacteriales bacterium]|jgi:hypothetical protein